MSIRIAIWALLAAALLAASCGGSGPEDAQGPSGSAAVSEAVPEEADGSEENAAPDAGDELPANGESAGIDTAGPMPLTLTESPMPEISRLVEELDGYDLSTMAACMNDAGYPQFLEAWSEYISQFEYPDPLSRSPMQIAPSTAEQAQAHGMVGIRDVWPPAYTDTLPMVLTDDDGYLAAQDSCWGIFPNFEPDIDEEIRDLETDFSDLHWDVDRAFADATVQPLEDLLREQLACVKANGYPQLDAADSVLNLYEPMQQPSWEPILRDAGVKVAPLRPPERIDGWDQPDEGIRVVLPSEGRSPPHEPTAAEIDFALVYVQCGQELGVMERFEQLQHEARMPILAQYETEILSLRDEVEALLARISQ